MHHCDDDVLALVALGEAPPPDEARHLEQCASCRAEVDAFRRVVDTARTQIVAGADVPPPPHVWEAVAAATGVTARPRTVPDRHSPPLPASPPPPAKGNPDGDDGRRPSADDDSVVTPLEPYRAGRSHRRWISLAAVAASALVVGGVLGAAGNQLLRNDQQPVVQVVARTTLAPLPVDPAARGSAVVVDQAGSRRLDVTVSRLAHTDGFYEVWLIDASVKKMVPIGILTGTQGEFTIPTGLDLAQYPVIDISAEPLDGNPAHSGNSLLRGTIAG